MCVRVGGGGKGVGCELGCAGGGGGGARVCVPSVWESV